MAVSGGLHALIAVCCIGVLINASEGFAEQINSGWKSAGNGELKENMDLRKPSRDEQNNLEEYSNGDSIMDPEKIGFYIYTKYSPKVPVRVFVNDTDRLKAAGYRFSKNTKIIVHGFMNHLTSPAIQQIKNSFLNSTHKEVNLIAVDWKYYAFYYGNEYARMVSLGRIIADLIDFLVREGTKLDDIHCIGHSLGAHGCGFAGAQVKEGLIGRITGLDPALPGFDYRDTSKRINADQAKFVDCIHTSGGYLAIYQPICTADYYPNRGSRQPGCEWGDYLSHGSCSHGRSHEYFAESITAGHVFEALSCNSTDFLTEHCVNKGAKMGYPATPKYKGIFYVETNKSYPYAKKIQK